MANKISVIIPVYNLRDYIDRCLKSVSNQTYKNLEVIIVDDGSTDGSNKIYEKYLNTDNRFILVDKENGGLSSARNEGIKACSGDYLYFLDGDDELPVYALKVLLDSILLYNSEVSIGNIKIIGNSNILLGEPTRVGYYSKEHDKIFKNYLFQIVAVNRLYKVDFVKNNNLFFFEGILHEDILWSYNIARRLNNFCYSSNKTYLYHIRNGSITQTKSKKNINSLKIIIEYISNDLNVNYDLCNRKERQNFIEMLALNCMNDQRVLDPLELIGLRDDLKKRIRPTIWKRMIHIDIKGVLKQLVYYLPSKIIGFYIKMLFKIISKSVINESSNHRK